jgi:TatD DNase family protein
MEIIDTHCHLSFAPLATDLEGVLHRAEIAGVSKIIVPAYDLSSWPAIRELAVKGNIFSAFGLHPWRAHEDLDLETLSGFIEGQRAVAVGEIGLDFKIDGEGGDRDRQLHVFRAQVALARDLDLPVILHCRGAFEEMLAILGAFAPTLKGVVHAYSRGPELVRRFVDLGLFIAFGGAVTRPNARRAHRSALRVPPDRLLVETDAPAIGLDGVAAEQTEPRHARDVVLALAQLRGERPSDLAALTTTNANALFGLDG